VSAIRFNPFRTSAAVEAEPDLYDVILLPERAVFWPARRTLMIADLHLGKKQTFWAAGAPIPAGVLDADLATLDHLIRRTEATRLLVLGDLLHTSIGLTPQLVDHVAAWRSRLGGGRHVEFAVVPGNHDRALGRVAEAWGLAITAAVHIEEGFAFRHDPPSGPGESGGGGVYTWSGHLHPQVRLSGRGDSLRLPCFWMTPTHAVLPAFSAFTRGMTIRPARGDRLFGVVDGDGRAGEGGRGGRVLPL
jgi:uncharacterized protein